jgi:hypothetical protein
MSISSSGRDYHLFTRKPDPHATQNVCFWLAIPACSEAHVVTFSLCNERIAAGVNIDHVATLRQARYAAMPEIEERGAGPDRGRGDL